MDAMLVVTAICMFGAFAVCGIPFGLLVGEKLGGVDVREHGSGNIGMTNVARSVGGRAAALTFACDFGKGLLWILLSKVVIGLTLPEGSFLIPTDPSFAALTLVYMCCVLGHVYSPYLNFKGGKGISVGFGAAVGLLWPMGFVAFALFLIIVLPSRYVSAGSIAAAISLPIQALFLWHFTPWATFPITVVACMVIWAHRENIIKLMNGQERRFVIKPASKRSMPKGDTARRNDAAHTGSRED